jgi:hypothetical protein
MSLHIGINTQNVCTVKNTYASFNLHIMLGCVPYIQDQDCSLKAKRHLKSHYLTSTSMSMIGRRQFAILLSNYVYYRMLSLHNVVSGEE